MVQKGDVDKALNKSIRSQHLYMPEIHKYTMYSVMRTCANNCSNSDILLGKKIRLPSSIFHFKNSQFDELYHKSFLHLSPQLREDMGELSTCAGYLLTDRRAAVFRYVFGDIFHGICNEIEYESGDEYSDEESDDINDKKELVQVNSFIQKQRSLLEEHLIRERAANFSPLEGRNKQLF